MTKPERDPLVLVKRALERGYVHSTRSDLLFLSTDGNCRWIQADQYFDRLKRVRWLYEPDWKTMPPIGINRTLEGVELPVSSPTKPGGSPNVELIHRRMTFVDESCVHAGFKPVFKLNFHGADTYLPTAIISPTEEDAVIVAGLFDGSMPD